MANRSMPEASSQMALTATELYLLDQLIPDRGPGLTQKHTRPYLSKLARLGTC